MAEVALRLVVMGRVQGVGFRMWLYEAASAAGASGWVRNRRDGSVEALIAGDRAIVEGLVTAIRAGGPPAGIVTETVIKVAEPPPTPGFLLLATE